MSEEKFTQGEWEASDIKINGEHLKNSWKVSVGGFFLADVTSGATFGVVDEIQKANAHLIAAAPNLYHALKRTTEELAFVIDRYNKKVKDPANFIDAETCHLNQIELAKARGEK